MKIVIIKICLLFWICSFSGTLWAETQHIILTDSEGTGSYIFASELARLVSASKKTNKSQLVARAEISAKNRLTQLSNNQISLAIIDAKTAHEQLNKHPGLYVLSVLWKNWLHVMGTVPGSFLSLDSSQTLLVHDNSLHFAKLWKKLAPQSQINWFNSSRIPDFKDGFSEEVLVVTGPAPLKEINKWLEQFAGIRLLSLDQQLMQALESEYPWLKQQKLPANIFSYQIETLLAAAWNPVLVTSRNFPEQFALTILNFMFSKKDALNPHFLFRNLVLTDNNAFQKIYPYHSAAKTMFRFK